MIIFVEFEAFDGQRLGHYWMNFYDQSHQACLAMRREDALKANISVHEYRVSTWGEMP